MSDHRDPRVTRWSARLALKNTNQTRGRGSVGFPQQRPDPVTSSAYTLPFEEAAYKTLRRRYLEPRVRENAELGGGMVLRRQTAPAIIDQNMPGFRKLKRQISLLDQEENHTEIYRLLRQLRDWEVHAGRMPRSMLEEGDAEDDVCEVVDLTQDHVAIDVDAFISDVLLIKVKEEPDDDSRTSQRMPPDVVTSLSPAHLAVDTDIGDAKTPSVQKMTDCVASASTVQESIGTQSNSCAMENSGSEAIAIVSKSTEGMILDTNTVCSSAQRSINSTSTEVIDVEQEPDSREKKGNQKPISKWTRGEDDNLMAAVACCVGGVDWLAVASGLPGRTRLQCLQRYERLLPRSMEGCGFATTRSQAQRATATTAVAGSKRFYETKLLDQSEVQVQKPDFIKSKSPTLTFAAITPEKTSTLKNTPDSVITCTSSRELRKKQKRISDFFDASIDSAGDVPEDATRLSTTSQSTLTDKDEGEISEWTPSTDEDYSTISGELVVEQAIDAVVDKASDILSSQGYASRDERNPKAKEGIRTAASEAEESVSCRRRFWTREEDILLRDTVEQKQQIKWSVIASKIPGRSGQITERGKLQGTVSPTIKTSLVEARRSESVDDLSSEWKAQLRNRRKGLWRPTGGWKPPPWACQPTSTGMAVKDADNKATAHPKSSSFLCGRAMAAQIDELITAHLRPSGLEEVRRKKISSLADVRYPSYEKPTDGLLTTAHSVLRTLLPEGDCDCIEVVRLARKYYDHWRPDQGNVRVILLAESHAFTSKDVALSTYLDSTFLADYKGPRDFVSLVYCLVYGENEAVATIKPEKTGSLEAFDTSTNKGTPQFWSLLAACSRGTEFPQSTSGEKSKTKFKFAADILKGGGLAVKERLLAKLSILEDLRERGIWLLDASVIGWYISQPQKYRRSKVSNEVHRTAKERPPKALKAPSLVVSWEMFTKHVVRAAAEEKNLRLLIPIGKEVEASLTRKRLEDAVSVATSDHPRRTPTRVTESFPAPNAWIPGGYGPFLSELARVVSEAAPPIKAMHSDPTIKLE